jgi:hypothetical protein
MKSQPPSLSSASKATGKGTSRIIRKTPKSVTRVDFSFSFSVISHPENGTTDIKNFAYLARGGYASFDDYLLHIFIFILPRNFDG